MSATSENAINKHGNIIGTQDVNTKIQVADQSHSSLYSIDHQDKERNSSISEVESGVQFPQAEEGPDGGYGWFVVLGAFFIHVASNGISTSWGIVPSNIILKHMYIGVMQDYYEQNYFHDVPNVTVILSFVGTLSSIVFYGCTPLAQVYASVVGFRFSLFTGTFLIALGLTMAGFSTQIWHLYLCQGLVFGLGAACNYVVVMGVTPQWFTKRRGFAFGVITSGSGIGGLVIPIIMNAINQSLGASWTFRIVGFLCFACDIIACCVIKENKPKPKTKKKLSQILRWECLKDINVLLFMIGSDIALFGYFIPYFFLPSYATYLGLSSSQGSALVAVAAACNFVGRIATGYLADGIGNINTNLLCTFITCISCLLIWTFAYTYETLMGFSVVFGFCSGSYFALISPITTHLVGLDKFLSTVSIIRFTNVIPLFGANIASAIEGNLNSEPYFSYKMFAGVANLVATIILLAFKLRVNRNFFAKI